MQTKPFKKAKAGYERAFVLPAAPLGHIAFALIFAVVFINLRIAGMRMGFDGFLIYAGYGVVALLITAIVLNLLPEKFVHDEGEDA